MASDERLIQAVQLAAKKLSSAGNFNLLMRDVLEICVEAVGASGGTIYLHDPAAKRLRFQHVLPASSATNLAVKDIPDDYGMAGSAFQTRLTDIKEFPEKLRSEWSEFEILTDVQVRNMVAAPLMIEDEEPIGVVQLINKVDGGFTSSDSAVLEIVSSVATMAYLNYRLKEESTRASTLLGMGKVGHDIGNLAASLYANLSFSYLAIDSLKTQSKSGVAEIDSCLGLLEPMLGDLRDSVDRIVGYSRLISDMSAGRPLRPDKKLDHLGPVVESSAAYLETDARSSRVNIRYEIERDAPATLFDHLYIFRIVQNLVGNAIKAVKESMPDDWIESRLYQVEPEMFGEVAVIYRYVDSSHIIEVADTGAGMTRPTMNRILSGNATSQWDKAGGSGWGTKIVLELAATHEGTVSIDSEIGKGSTFRVSLPHRRAELEETLPDRSGN